MSDAVKWGLLVAGAVVVIGLVFALPFTDFINLDEFSAQISIIVQHAGDFFRSARGIINNFLSPFGRTMLTGLMGWLFGKFAIMTTIKISTWVYHFIFK